MWQNLSMQVACQVLHIKRFLCHNVLYPVELRVACIVLFLPFSLTTAL